MKARFAAVVAAITAATPTAAQAPSPNQWFVLSAADNKCHPAAQMFPLAATPERIHNYLRSQGVLDKIQVQKDEAGQVLYVTIVNTIHGDTGSMLWAPDQQKCEAEKLILQQNGTIPNMNDLK